MSRASGELLRARHALDNLRCAVDAVALVLDDAERSAVPPGKDAAQLVTGSANNLAMSLVALDAYIRSESDAPVPPVGKGEALP